MTNDRDVDQVRAAGVYRIDAAHAVPVGTKTFTHRAMTQGDTGSERTRPCLSARGISRFVDLVQTDSCMSVLPRIWSDETHFTIQ